MIIAFDIRRKWFNEYCDKVNGELPAFLGAKTFTCPCCGYPTLDGRGDYSICHLCFWEDDGQDDPEADEIWGGPNGVWSLTDARNNFDKNLTSAMPHGEGRNTPLQYKLKQHAVSIFDSMVGETDDVVISGLWELFNKCNELLCKESSRENS